MARGTRAAGGGAACPVCGCWLVLGAGARLPVHGLPGIVMPGMCAASTANLHRVIRQVRLGLRPGPVPPR